MIFQLKVIKENSIALEKKRIQQNKTVVSNIQKQFVDKKLVLILITLRTWQESTDGNFRKVNYMGFENLSP